MDKMKKMKRMACGLMMAAIALGIQARDYKYETVEGDPMKARIYTLDNGLKVYLSVNKEKPNIQTYIAVRTGSRNDPAETTGLAHYLEHLMFKGTTHFGTTDYAAEKLLLDQIEAKYEVYRTLTDTLARKQCYREIDSLSQEAARYFVPNEIDKLLSSFGATEINAFTSNDRTVYVENIPSNAVEKWLKVETERFQNMTIRGFHTELEAVYEEYNIYSAQDDEHFSNAFFELLFPGHPYGTQTVIGRPEHLKNPSITNIKNYFNRYYVPNNMAVCMAGDLDPDQTIALIDRYMGGWKPNASLTFPQFPAIAPQKAARDTTVWGQEAERMFMGWRAKDGSSRQTDTLEVIQRMLCNGKAGMMETDLEQSMRLKGVYAFLLKMQDYSAFGLQCYPKDNQSLEEVRALVAEELDKLKRGDFPEELLQAVVSNMKLEYFKSLLDNDSRAYRFVDAFVMGKDWKDEVETLDRISGMTKRDIVDFANRFFTEDQMVCVYKKQGERTNDFKIAKPEITPIMANRDQSSQWLTDFIAEELPPMAPRFVDFQKDMTVSAIGRLPLLYKQNTDDGLFHLSFVYDLGLENIKGLGLAPDYLYYIGTDKKTSAEINQAFYQLACSYRVQVEEDRLIVSLEGLDDNMPEALALLEDFLQHAKGDKESYASFVDLVKKEREDAKYDQSRCFEALKLYVFYGQHNRQTYTLSNEELESADPQLLPGMLNSLNQYAHKVLYFGPTSEKEVARLIRKAHKTPKASVPVPEGKPFRYDLIPRSEVLVAPYDAKNIYMLQFHNENRVWTPQGTGVKRLFNEYYGGNMSSITFQELRESRALAYSAFAQYLLPRKKQDPEGFITYIISQNDKMMDCINTFRMIIDTIPQSQSAFDIAMASMKKSCESRRVTRQSVLYACLQAQRLGLDKDVEEMIYGQLPSLTLKDVVSFEQQTMARKPLRTGILGDESQLDVKSLEKLGPVSRLTLKDIFGY